MLRTLRARSSRAPICLILGGRLYLAASSRALICLILAGRLFLAVSSRAPVCLILAGWLLLFVPINTTRAEEPSSTLIYDAIVVGDDACMLEIQREPISSVCAGQPIRVEAVLECGQGKQPVHPPQWFLDGKPAGEGAEIEISVEPGVHLLQVTCGSCQDEITIEGIECALRLDALYADDESEATGGLYLQRNPGPVTPQNFAQMRYTMRPFMLSVEDSSAAEVLLESIGEDILDLFALDGSPIELPANIAPADLPLAFLARAHDFGDGRLRATRILSGSSHGSASSLRVPANQEIAGEAADSDEVRVRVTPWPGLTGRALDGYPFFHTVDTFNDDSAVQIAFDPTRHRERIGLACDLYVVSHKTPEQWASNNLLVDVTGQVESIVIAEGSIADNVHTVWSSGLQAGPLVSRSYDVVCDFDGNGRLDPGDLIDGLGNSEAGCYVVKDLATSGPYGAVQGDYSGGTWLTQRVYYPSNLALLGAVPLITIGHGNGHQHTWYDYLGQHLASHGYVVMSYRNDTGPGIETASTTTLTNIDYLLTHRDTILGGVLNGHLDTRRIAWIGHSRGGEGVVRAYDRIHDGNWSPQGYALEDVRAVASIAPTVYLTPAETDPHHANYYLIVGGADGDVTGRPDLPGDQYFRISDRSLGLSRTSYVHGATHNDFNCCGFDDGIGPDQIGRPEAQRVAKSYFLALAQLHLSDAFGLREYFTRLYDDLAPSGIAPHVEIANTHRIVDRVGDFVIDDFQSSPALDLSSSGGTVSMTVSNAFEGPNEDNNTSFTWVATDPMNGMIFHSGGGDFSRGLVFDHPTGEARTIEFEVVPDFGDVRAHRYLSFRACQGTRHPETNALNDSHSFGVTLRDELGRTSTIRFGEWGKITRLYARTGSGTGAGWVNEMNTVRIPLTVFETDGSDLDLSRIAAIRLEFGSPFGSPRGRLGLDDLQFEID